MLHLGVTVLLLALLVVLTGCEKSSEKAHLKLGQLGIKYTQEDFLESAENGDTIAIKLFIAAGMNPNTKDDNGWTALMRAIAGSLATVEEAKDLKDLAVCEGCAATVEAFLNNGADVNAKGNTGETALILAAVQNNDVIVQLLLDNGADVNANQDEGYTALMGAVLTGNITAARAFLAKGADVNAKSAVDGSTALNMARNKGHTEIVQ